MVTTEQTNKQTESDNRASQLIGTCTADFRNTNRQEIQTQPVRCSASLSASPPSAGAPSEFPASSSGGSPLRKVITMMMILVKRVQN